MAYGIRAMSKTLDSYARRGLVTIEQVISTWAPASENQTGAYIAAVEAQTGIARDTFLRPEDRSLIIAAIIKHENGAALGAAVIAYGLSMS